MDTDIHPIINKINIRGKLYVYFTRSLFNGNKRIGIEMIINTIKSDFSVINGLKRLNIMKDNRIQIMNGNYPIDFNIINIKYLAEVEFAIDDIIKIESLKIIKMDRQDTIHDKIHKSIYLNKYATGKNRTVNDIMNILKSSS